MLKYPGTKGLGSRTLDMHSWNAVKTARWAAGWMHDDDA